MTCTARPSGEPDEPLFDALSSDGIVKEMGLDAGRGDPTNGRCWRNPTSPVTVPNGG